MFKKVPKSNYKKAMPGHTVSFNLQYLILRLDNIFISKGPTINITIKKVDFRASHHHLASSLLSLKST